MDSYVFPARPDPRIVGIIQQLAHWHLAYEHAADPNDFESAGAMEAAELSARVGELLASLGRPVQLG
jgi:hypothetical protein